MKMENLEEKKPYDSFFITQQTSLSKATGKLCCPQCKVPGVVFVDIEGELFRVRSQGENQKGGESIFPGNKSP